MSLTVKLLTLTTMCECTFSLYYRILIQGSKTLPLIFIVGTNNFIDYLQSYQILIFIYYKFYFIIFIIIQGSNCLLSIRRMWFLFIHIVPAGNIVDFWNSDFPKKSQLDLPSAWIFFLYLLICMNFFSWHFPLHEFFFLVFSPPPPPPHHSSNGPSLTWKMTSAENGLKVFASKVVGKQRWCYTDRGAGTRDEPLLVCVGRFFAQDSIAMLEQCCNHMNQCRNNFATLYCAKNRFCESSRVTCFRNIWR